MSRQNEGLLLYNKPPGLTSFESLSVIKKTFNTGKVGHTGTLDKFASGLLLVLIGRAVKLTPLLIKVSKEYFGSIQFGIQTDTLDPEGKIIDTAEIPARENVEKAIESFKGKIEQAPPLYSAIHINGKRAHELAREGKEPEMKKRAVTVYNLELISWNPPAAEIYAKVSSGTYIRSLARDIGIAAGSRAHLKSLVRTKVGLFSLEDIQNDNTWQLHPVNKKLFDSLSLPVFFIEDRKKFLQGKPLETILQKEDLSLSPDTPGNKLEAAGVFNKDDTEDFLGYIVKNNGKWAYGRVYADS